MQEVRVQGMRWRAVASKADGQARRRRRAVAAIQGYIQSLHIQVAESTNRALALEKAAREAKEAAKHFELAARIAWLNSTRVWMEAFPASDNAYDGARAAAQMARLVADLALAESELEAIKGGVVEHPIIVLQ